MDFSHLFVAVLALTVTSCMCDVDTKWMRDTLEGHFSQARHHWTNPDYKLQAMRFIRDQFRSYGLETHIHTFPTAQPNVTGVNVIGMLRGPYFNTPQDRVVGIAAHYDTMRNTPGVDDNGAAVVTMLQAAKELALHPKRNYTVVFVSFDFEEWEYPNTIMAACTEISCGSRSLITQWGQNFWTLPIGWRGIFVMDTIMNFDSQQQSQNFSDGIGLLFPNQSAEIQSDGRRGDFLMVAGREREDQPLLNAFSSAWNQQGQPQFEMETFPIPQQYVVLDSDLSRSDHYSFWMVGMNALFISDTADFRGYMGQCYHQACDTMQHVTDDMINFAAKTCRTLISVINKLSPVIDGSTSAAGRQEPMGQVAIVVAAVILQLLR